MGLSELTEILKRKHNVKKFYARIEDDHVDEPGYAATRFRPGEGYLVITLPEMYLRNSREYWHGYIPLCLVITEFMYGGETHVTPFFVGNRILTSAEPLLEDKPVEFRNTEIAGPFPYEGDSVGLFVGLFRVEVDDFAENLFGCIQEIAGAFSTVQLSPYLGFANAVMKHLSGLLRMDNIQFRLGTRDVFVSRAEGHNALKSGYLAYINCAKSDLKKQQLWIKDGCLYVDDVPDNTCKIHSYIAHDYCLVKIDHLGERSDYQKLPFYSVWEDIHRCIWEGQIDRVQKQLWPQLVREVALSPDLIPNDRFHLQTTFKLNLVNESNLYEQTKNPLRAEKKAKRGGSDISSGAATALKANFQKAAAMTKNEIVKRALYSIAGNSDEISIELRREPEKRPLEQERLLRQLRKIREVAKIDEPDSVELAETFTANALHLRSPY